MSVAHREVTFGSFREELQAMPTMHRGIVYVALFFMLALFVEAVVILPLIVIRWGWGYTVG